MNSNYVMDLKFLSHIQGDFEYIIKNKTITYNPPIQIYVKNGQKITFKIKI